MQSNSQRAPMHVPTSDLPPLEPAVAALGGSVLRTDCDRIGILVDAHERRAIALKPVTKGERIFGVEGQETPVPTRYSVQVGWALHLDQSDARDPNDRVARRFWRYMNHSCEPSTLIRDREVTALRDIAPGEDITFDYNTTEYDMAEPFTCRCGTPSCVGTVKGAKHLTPAQRARIAHLLPDYLR